MIPHNRVMAQRSDARAVARTVLSGRWAQGPRVAELEQRLGALTHVAHVVCVGSGLAALRLALKGLGVGPGDRVLVPGYCCVALPNAVLSLGAVPERVDVTPGEWNIDPVAVGAANAKAVLAVNTFGYPAVVDGSIPVIEDCSHALGLEVGGRPLGGRSPVGVISFYATKLVGAGEGGAVMTNDADLAALVRQWRDYANQEPDGTRLNDKMTDLEATLALCQLDRLAAGLAERRRLATRYRTELAGCRGFRLPLDHGSHAWYRFVLETRAPDALIAHLAQAGVEAAYPVAPWGSTPPPVSAAAYASLVSIPLYPGLTLGDQSTTIRALQEWGASVT